MFLAHCIDSSQHINILILYANTLLWQHLPPIRVQPVDIHILALLFGIAINLAPDAEAASSRAGTFYKRWSAYFLIEKDALVQNDLWTGSSDIVVGRGASQERIQVRKETFRSRVPHVVGPAFGAVSGQTNLVFEAVDQVFI